MSTEETLLAQSEERLRFETLVADLSSKFILVPSDDLDRLIEDWQRQVCECLGLDVSSLWQWAADEPNTLVMTHLYRRFAGPATPERFDAREHFPWAFERLKAGKVVALRMSNVPAEAARDLEAWLHFGLKTVLNLPLIVGGERPIGLLSFNDTRTERDWADALVQRIQMVAQIFANALGRREADRALRRSEELLSLSADSAGAGLWSLNLASGEYWVTQKTRQLFAFGPDEVVTLERFLSSVYPEDKAAVRRVIEEVVKSEKEGLVEFRIVRPDGEVRWMSSRGRARYGGSGKADRLMGVTVDVTERKMAEEALSKSYAEIRELKDRLQTEADYLKAEIKVSHAHGEIIGSSRGIRQVLQSVEQVAMADCPVLISGETGTGKELVAQEVHRLSRRKDRVMVLVNCAALPTALVESELFGRERGAYTGAMTSQVGRFEVANGSTIFLDEIAELTMEVQAKLLRVLQQGEFQRLGSPKTHKVDVRVLAATNRELAEEVRKGRFREDLYYRLRVFPIEIPPLRERAEDIPALAFAFLQNFSVRMGKKITKVPRKAMEALQRHSWPGNIRELRNVIEHSTILSSGDTLELSALGDSPARETEPVTLEEAEREHISKALEKTSWRIKGPYGAAERLGLQPSTLYSRMQKLGIPHRHQKESVPRAG